jgi:hypothetical protein
LHNPKIVKTTAKHVVTRWTGYVECTGEKGNILVRKPEGNVPLGRSRRRWEDNNRLDLREIGWEVVDWIHLVQDRDQWWLL